jgi:hypothetical protein
VQQQEGAGSPPPGGDGFVEWPAGANGSGRRAAVAADGRASDRAADARRSAERREAERREVVDGGGVRWRVYELARPGDPGRRGGRCLVFDSDAVVRRVATYPAGWHDLPPAELLALSWGR